jgi:hypothetical protein
MRRVGGGLYLLATVVVVLVVVLVLLGMTFVVSVDDDLLDVHPIAVR